MKHLIILIVTIFAFNIYGDSYLSERIDKIVINKVAKKKKRKNIVQREKIKNRVPSLSLRNVNIQTLPKLFSDLKYLSIKNSLLNNIFNIQYLKNLEYLDISNNEINNIFQLQYLKQLKYLDLSNNRIENIFQLQYLKKLEYLDLSNNKINNIFQLQYINSLKYLNLSNNRLRSIPINLVNLSNLLVLDLTNNNIKDYSIIKKMTNLRILILDGRVIILKNQKLEF